MKKLASILALAVMVFGIYSFILIAQEQEQIALQKEVEYCAGHGFSDIKECRAWWTAEGDPSRKR